MHLLGLGSLPVSVCVHIYYGIGRNWIRILFACVTRGYTRMGVWAVLWPLLPHSPDPGVYVGIAA